MALMLGLAVLPGAPAFATDVDGGGDCMKTGTDFGDAPETIDAYAGVPGRFPEHPDLANSLDGLATALRELGEQTKAASLEARANAIREKSRRERGTEARGDK
jgi:hypothetical protein